MDKYIYNENMQKQADTLADRWESINLARAADDTSVVSVDGVLLELANRVAASKSAIEFAEWLKRLADVAEDTLNELAEDADRWSDFITGELVEDEDSE